MPISRSTRNEGHAHILVTSATAQMRCRINIGTSTIPGATDATSTTRAEAKSLVRDTAITVAYRFTGQSSNPIGENITVRMGVKFVEDDGDTLGGSTNVVNYTQGFAGTVALPSGGTNPNTSIAGATGTFTIPASAPTKGGSYKFLLVLDNLDDNPTPPSSNDVNFVLEWYADTDGNNAFNAAVFSALSTRGTAWGRTDTTIEAIEASKQVQEWGDDVTVTIDPTRTLADSGTSHQLVNPKQWRTGPIKPSFATTVAPVKVVTATPPADGSEVTTAAYTVDGEFGAGDDEYRLRLHVGPRGGNSATVTAEQPDFWSHADGGGNTYGTKALSDSNDQAWTYFTLPTSGPDDLLTKKDDWTVESDTPLKVNGARFTRRLGLKLGNDPDDIPIYGVNYLAAQSVDSDLPELVVVQVAPDSYVTAGDWVAYGNAQLREPLGARPASDFPFTNQVDSREDFADEFLGIAKTSGSGGTFIQVYISPFTVFEVDCVSETHKIGDLMTMNFQTATMMSPTKLEKAVLTGGVIPERVSVARCMRVDSSASDRVLVRLQSYIWGWNLAASQ